MRVLTLDLGLGALKVCLWEDCALVARQEAALPTQVEGDRAEQDARVWWETAVALVRRLAARHPEAAMVDVLGVTGHMHALVPTDAEGIPLGPVAIVSDRRARAACRELEAEFGIRTILRWTGGRLDPTCVPAKARHFRQTGDPAWRAARRLLPPKDFLRFHLIGTAVTDPIDAAGTMLWDMETQDWQPDLLAFTGCAPQTLPSLCPTVSIPGRLSRAAADALGLRAGTPVATGGGDDIEAFGAGALTPGALYEHLGTTGSIYVTAEQPIFDPEARVETYPDVMPGRWLVGGSTSAAGLAQRWMLALQGRSEDWPGVEALFARMAAERRPAEPLFLPYLAGERAPLWDGDRAGAMLGLRTHHGPETVLQATVEGIVFSLRAVLEAVGRLQGLGAAGSVHVSGPLGAGKALGEVRADIYGREVVRYATSEDTTSFAAMLLASCAVTGENPYTAAERLLVPVWTAAPQPASQARYEHAYRRFARATAHLAALDTATEESRA